MIKTKESLSELKNKLLKDYDKKLKELKDEKNLLENALLKFKDFKVKESDSFAIVDGIKDTDTFGGNFGVSEKALAE